MMPPWHFDLETLIRVATAQLNLVTAPYVVIPHSCAGVFKMMWSCWSRPPVETRAGRTNHREG